MMSGIFALLMISACQVNAMTETEFGIVPRGLPLQAAAAYVGVTEATFNSLVRDGRMPRPLTLGREQVWDRVALDAAFDGLSGDTGNPLSCAGPGEFEPECFTPMTLAERWSCSPRHVRRMIKDGLIPHFMFGGKLLRIKREDVLAFEQAGLADER
jgi:excisionase family DNA binding protein